MTLVAGVDSSTGSTKVEIRDAETGAVVASGTASHPVTTPPKSEQHPHDWWAAFEAAWQAAGAPDIGAISVGGQQHGMVVLNGQGNVIRPAKLWNDTESAPNATSLVERGGGAQAWAARCGSVPVAAFTVTKLDWLREHEPAAFAAIRQVLLPHDWLTYRLTGSYSTDRGDASGTGYWSPLRGEYCTDMLSALVGDLPWADLLPQVLAHDTVAGEWRGALVGAGTGDNMAAALGCGLQPGDIAISLGTSGTVYSVAAAPTSDPTGAVAGFADATGRYLPLVCTLNATKVTEAVRRLLGVDHEEFNRLALLSAPGAGRLTLLPYLDGERTPNRPNASGVLGGIRSDVSREQLARAAVEGVICGMLDGVDALGQVAPTDSGRLVLLGGGAKSVAFQQVLADLTGRPVVVPSATEHVATGAAVLAAALVRGEEPMAISAAWGLGHGVTVEPSLSAASAEAAVQIRARYAHRRDLEV